MFKTFTHTIIFLLSATQLFGQAEWIRQGQRYFRIPVFQSGTYQITAAELRQSKIPVDSIQPTALQIFRRGKQVPLTFEGGNIIFKAQKKQGEGDSALYINPAFFPKTIYSLYSDTAAYFLTWNKDFSEHDIPHVKSADSPSLGFHFEEIVHSYHSHYNPGAFYPPESGFEDGAALSDYDEGEGWTGPEIKIGDSVQVVFDTKMSKAAPGSLNVAEVAMTGWAPGAHQFKVYSKYGHRIVSAFEFENYQSRSVTFSLAPKDFNAAGTAELTIKPVGTKAHAALTYAKLKFLSKNNLEGNKYLKIASLTPVTFPEIDSTSFECLIITHSSLKEAAQTYAAYRSSTAGGSFKTRVLLISDIFNQFHFGDPGPAGLRNAIAYFHRKHRTKFVFLIGASVDPQKARKSKVMLDLIPNAGWPGSDVALAMQPGSLSPPLVAIGRLNATSPQQILDYLAKVKAVEAEPASAPWRKRILHLSGGRTRDELTAFRSYVQEFEATLSKTDFQPAFQTISKETDAPVEHLPVEKSINEGVALVTLFGHSGTNATDLDIGYASSPERTYANAPRYPAVIVNGCASGSIFYSNKTLSTDWIFTPAAGAVLFLAHTSNGVSTALRRYTGIFYEVLADSTFTHQPFGLVQQEAIRRNLAHNPDIYDRITVHQMNLHGDPAICIFPKNLKPDTTTTNSPKPQSYPVALISIDGRQVKNDDFVSQTPTIGIQLIETVERAEGDTTGISIWLKPGCAGCSEYRLSLHNAQWSWQNSWLIEVPVRHALSPGTYLLTARLRDLNGNFAPIYQIRFQVSDSLAISDFGVAPNPSASWFRFHCTLSAADQLSRAEIEVFDLQGRSVHYTTVTAHAGLNEYYWLPAHLPGGLYTYRLAIFTGGPPLAASGGTVLTGRLLWVR